MQLWSPLSQQNNIQTSSSSIDLSSSNFVSHVQSCPLLENMGEIKGKQINRLVPVSIEQYVLYWNTVKCYVQLNVLHPQYRLPNHLCNAVIVPTKWGIQLSWMLFIQGLHHKHFKIQTSLLEQKLGARTHFFLNVRECTHTRGSTNHFDTTTVVAIAILTSWVQLQCRLGCVCTCKSWWESVAFFLPESWSGRVLCAQRRATATRAMAMACVLAELSFREGNISKAGPLLNKFCGRWKFRDCRENPNTTSRTRYTHLRFSECVSTRQKRWKPRIIQKFKSIVGPTCFLLSSMIHEQSVAKV